MRIGIMFGARREVLGVEALIQRVQQIEQDGFSSFWVPHLSSLGFDALTALALVGHHTSRIELGTAVVPVYPFHPTALAQHAMTAQVASNGRLALGIGLSSQARCRKFLGPILRQPSPVYAGISPGSPPAD